MTPETTQKRSKRRWSRGDKLLVIIPAVLAVAACGLFFWLRALDKPPVVSLPPPTVRPAVNARDYFLKAAAAAAQTGSVAPNSEALRLLHQGFQYPYQEPPHSAFGQPRPELREMRVLARQLAKQAKADAGQGRWGASADAGMDALQMGVTVTHGADFDGTLFIYSQNAGEEPLWKVVGYLNAAQARAGARRLEAIRANRVPYVKMLREQKASIQRRLSQEMNQPNWRDDWITTTPPVLTYPRAWRNHVLSTTCLRLTSKQQILTANAKYMDALITAAQQPYAAHPAYPLPPGDLVNQLSDVSHYGDLWLGIVNLDTQNALLLTSFALRAYRLDHGTYPAVLAALVPGYLNAVPTDPFALSGPLRYKLVGAKYVLYSVGPDSKDNSGSPILSDTNNWINKDSIGDVVAGVNIN